MADVATCGALVPCDCGTRDCTDLVHICVEYSCLIDTEEIHP